MLGSMVRRGAKRLLSARRSAAKAKVSSHPMAGTGISIHSSRGRSCPQLFSPWTVHPDRRNGLVTFCLCPTCVLLKQAAPLYAGLRNIAQTTDRSQRVTWRRVGGPISRNNRAIAPMLRPSLVYLSYISRTTSASTASIS